MTKSFSETLNRLMRQTGCSLGKLAKLSGIPKSTIRNWKNAGAKKPQHWRDVAKLAMALEVPEAEATELLQAASWPSVAELRRTYLSDQDQKLLTFQPQPEPAPFFVPAELDHFVGRGEEIRAITTVLLNGHSVIGCSLHGMGGIGKTSLGLHLAYQLRPHFPDGVLWAKLDASDTLSILALFAQAYKQDVSGYRTVEERATVVRGILANKRVLLVLDNVESSDQVRPLLPPTTGKPAVIITTRRHDLAITNRLKRYHLAPFDRQKNESWLLFTSTLEEERVKPYQPFLLEIADLLGHLPLALAIAAARLKNEPSLTVVNLRDSLRHGNQRLNALIQEDRSVRLAFASSYQALTSELQGFFAALGLFGGEDFGVTAVASVTGVSEKDASEQLDKLYLLSLVTLGRPGRYRLHRLLRDYACEQPINFQTTHRVVAFFVDYIEQNRQDFSRLDIELGNIFTALDKAFEHEMVEFYSQGIVALSHYLEVRGQYDLAEKHLHQALGLAQASHRERDLMLLFQNLALFATKRGHQSQAELFLKQSIVFAERLKDDTHLLTVLTMLGGIAFARGEYDRCEAYWRECLALAKEKNNLRRQAAMFVNLGAATSNRGHYSEARQLIQEGLALAEAIDYSEGVIVLLSNLANINLDQGKYDQAEIDCRRSLKLAQQWNSVERTARLFITLADIAFAQGHFDEADKTIREALGMVRRVGHTKNISLSLARMGYYASQLGRFSEAKTYLHESLELAKQGEFHTFICAVSSHLGICMLRTGDLVEAELYLRESRRLARDVANPMQWAIALNSWGEYSLATEKHAEAEQAFAEALEIHHTFQMPENGASSYFGLARKEKMVGNWERAQQYGEKSLTIFTSMGHYREIEIKGWLEHKG